MIRLKDVHVGQTLCFVSYRSKTITNPLGIRLFKCTVLELLNTYNVKIRLPSGKETVTTLSTLYINVEYFKKSWIRHDVDLLGYHLTRISQIEDLQIVE